MAAFLTALDLPGAAVKLYQVIRQDKELNSWLKLIFSTAYSGFLGLSGASGAALIAHQPPWVALGYGLTASASAVLAVLLRAPQARGLIFSVPSSVVQQYQQQGQVTIAPADQKR